MNSRLTRLLVLLAGIVLGQAVLYGPSLIGRKVLLPLDILTAPGFYLPRTPELAGVEVQNMYLQDLVCVFEPARRFAAAEVHAGRFPMWLPYEYGGSPFIEPKFSPFLAPQLCVESPLIIPWMQMVAALVAGSGAHLFFRRILGVRFWPAVICAWCYPLTAFFIFWQGYPTGNSVYWLPWLLLAVNRTARGGSRFAPIGLAVVTCLVLISGHIDVGAQVLLVGGIYALWRLYEETQSAPGSGRLARAVVSLCAAWGLGILVATPHILPLVEYTHTGARFERRTAGEEERPPVGLSALPQVVLPEMYGAYGPDKTGSYRIAPDNQAESTAAAYAGVMATLFLAPLAFCSRRHRSSNIFWVALIGFALSWQLNVPGLVSFLRLPGLNVLSHSRMVFIFCFGVLALAAVGLNALAEEHTAWRRWMWGPVAALALLTGWCVYRTVWLPEPIATQLRQAVLVGNPMGWVHDLTSVHRVQSWFVVHSAMAAGFCFLGLLGWLLLEQRPHWRMRLLPWIALVMGGELLWFGYGRSVQCDPSLDFPPVKVLQEIAHSVPGRIAGYFCLPATLAGACGLSDLRGYDGVDPLRMVELLQLAAGPPTSTPDYALTQYLVPRASPTAEGGVRLPPVLDMLNVRYVIFRGSPMLGARPAFHEPDYWVLVNSNALDRVFVPRRVECIPDKSVRLKSLASDLFNPREVAYVEAPLPLPSACSGKVSIEEEVPTRVTVSGNMDTPGLLVLGDRWDKGWHAYVSGKETSIVVVNHAVRGVVLPAGPVKVQFRYEPASFALGLKLAAAAAAILAAWSIFIFSRRSEPAPPGECLKSE